MDSGIVLLAALIKLFFVMLFIGWIPAVIAKSKGRRNFFGWWVYGGALFIIALVHALLIKSKKEGEDLQPTATEFGSLGKTMQEVPEDLRRKLRQHVGGDAITHAYVTDTKWICVCGTQNSLDRTKEIQNCSACHRNRDFVLHHYNEEKIQSLPLQVEEDDDGD